MNKSKRSCTGNSSSAQIIEKLTTIDFGFILQYTMGSPHVRKLLDFLKLYSRVEKSPGFSYALGLDYDSISAVSKHISFTDEEKTLTVRLPMNDDMLLPKHDSIALSTCLAIIDEITTWAMVLACPHRSRPGVSVSLTSEWGPASKNIGEQVDIVAKVKKIGRNLGFANAEIRDATSGDLICFGSHVKYLSGMGMATDFLLSHYGWNIAKLYSDYAASPPGAGDMKPMKDLFGALHFVSRKRATFGATAAHASLGGPLHGGAQAVLMELAAEEVMRGSNLSLDLMHIEYMSPPSLKVDLNVEIVPQVVEDSRSLRVQLLGEGKLKSEGVLRFAKTGPLVSSSKL